MNTRDFELLMLSTDQNSPEVKPPDLPSDVGFDLLDLMTVVTGDASPELVARVGIYVQTNPDSEAARMLATFRGYSAKESASVAEPIDSTPASGTPEVRAPEPALLPKHRPAMYLLPYLLLAAGVAGLLISGAWLAGWWGNKTPEPIESGPIVQPKPPAPAEQTTALAMLYVKGAKNAGLTNLAQPGERARFQLSGMIPADTLEFREPTERSRGVLYHVGTHGILRLGVFDRGSAKALAGSCPVVIDPMGAVDAFVLVLVDANAPGADLVESLDSLLTENEREQLQQTLEPAPTNPDLATLLAPALKRLDVTAPVDIRLIATVVRMKY